MTVRMKDIARDLDISVVTVSKVLRNHSDISAETRERVLKRMRELNYQPNLAARALVTGRSFAIGLVVPDLLHPFFAQVAISLAATLRERGYCLILASSEEDPAIEQSEIQHLLSRRVDALIIASAQSDLTSFRAIEDQRRPYVLIDRTLPELAANFVGTDDRLAGRLATAHLVSQGCRRIAHIRGPEVSTSTGRFEGYCSELAQRGLPVLPELMAPISSSGDGRGPEGGYEATRKLLELPARPDGIFCYNDPVALGAMRAVLDAGLDVPKDVAIVGCGNLHYANFLRIPLSSIDQQDRTIGEQAAALALSLVGLKQARTPRSIVLEPKLVARQSSLRD